MKFKWNRIFILTLVSVSLVTPKLFAEEADQANHSDGKPAVAAEGARPIETENKLSEKELTLLTKAFPSQTNDSVIEHWGTRLPEALDKKDLPALARISAELWREMNYVQRDKVLAAVEPEKNAEAEKEPHKRDNRYLQLTKVLFWGAKLVKGERVKTDEAEPFNKLFDKEFDAVQTENTATLEKLKQALVPGNTLAKDDLRKNLSRSNIMNFIDEQRKSGNGKLASDLTNALSWAQPDGQHYMDLWGPGKQPQRLYLGKNAQDHQDALQAYSNKFGGFGGRSLSQHAHAAEPEAAWFAKKDATTPVAQLVKGRPVENQPSQAPSEAGKLASQSTQPAGAAGTQATQPARPTASTPTPARSAPASGGPNIESAKSQLTNCTGCHNNEVTGTSFANMKVTVTVGGKRSEPKSLSQVLEALNRPSMRGVDAKLKDRIREWASKI